VTWAYSSFLDSQRKFFPSGKLEPSVNFQRYLKARAVRGLLMLVSVGKKQTSIAFGHRGSWTNQSRAATVAVKRGQFCMLETEIPLKVSGPH
jgi:hypothetical protein